MTEIQAGAIGRRGRHPELGARFGLGGGRDTEQRATVTDEQSGADEPMENKDAAAPGSVAWKEGEGDD